MNPTTRFSNRVADCIRYRPGYPGGGFRHGHHLRLDEKNNTPLSNLYVQLLQRMKVDVDTFGTSSVTSLNGVELQG